MEQKTDAQKTILIVEDEKNIVDILRFNLQREGYRTVEAYDGADGLEKARKENPDLILLDVMLPKMIGFDVCRTLREEGNNVPVIILTAREEEADKVSGLEIGADDYITKPFSMRELIARVGANIRRTAMNTAAAATAGPCPVASPHSTEISTIPVQIIVIVIVHASLLSMYTAWTGRSYLNFSPGAQPTGAFRRRKYRRQTMPMISIFSQISRK